MIHHEDILNVLRTYDPEDIHIGVLGGHSALDVCRGAKKHGFKTVAVCQKGREKTYDKYYKARGGKGCIDETIVLSKFSDITQEKVVKKLQRLNTIFIHNRYFWVYFDFNKIENDFAVPIFGTRGLLKTEERDQELNQYHILRQAGIRIPRMYNDPHKIDRLVLVKTPEAERGYERAFFFASSYEEYKRESDEMVKKLMITEEGLKNATIEEFVVGAQVNFNFFYSPLTDELELMGTDTRRQTNLDGLLRVPAPYQADVLKHVPLKYIETGHITCTIKESLIEKAYEAGENFVAATKEVHPPGIIGPFALQGAITAGPPKEEFVVFDVSMRIPGSPGTRFTPYSGYLYGDSISYGERIAMELRKAIDEKRLMELVT